MHNVIVSVDGHDVDLISFCVKHIGYTRYYQCIIDKPRFGIGVEPDS